MSYLLDVNVLIALFDPAHPNHEDAHEWFGGHRRRGWATCPLTIHGFVRVVSNPAYPTVETTPAGAISHLRTLCADTHHEFWADDLSLLDEVRFRASSISSSKVITDVYLLALALQRGGRLATFDRSTPVKAVSGAEPRHLELLGRRRS